MRAMRIEDNELVESGGKTSARGTGRFEELATGFVVRSIGYQGLPIPGVPFDAKRGVVPNAGGRVLGPDGAPLSGLYVTGWIKRGPTGLIGTNKACAKDTVELALADLATLPAPATETSDLDAMLASRGARVVDYDAWRKVDSAELERGKSLGKVRDKLANVDDMLAIALPR